MSNKKLTNGKRQNDTPKPYKGVTAANMLAVLAALNPMQYTRAEPIKAARECIHCKTKHRHNNSFCSTYCCHAWRDENPLRGRGNHYFGQFNLAYRTVNGVEELLS